VEFSWSDRGAIGEGFVQAPVLLIATALQPEAFSKNGLGSPGGLHSDRAFEFSCPTNAVWHGG
jgi:hypothetical protein